MLYHDFTLLSILIVKIASLNNLLKDIWIFTVIVPLLGGVVVTLGAGGATLLNRIFGGAVCGTLIGIFYSIATAIIGHNGLIMSDDIVVNGLWRVFIFTMLSAVGVILTEIKLPEPKAAEV